MHLARTSRHGRARAGVHDPADGAGGTGAAEARLAAVVAEHASLQAHVAAEAAANARQALLLVDAQVGKRISRPRETKMVCSPAHQH